jgi:hypothetical protein
VNSLGPGECLVCLGFLVSLALGLVAAWAVVTKTDMGRQAPTWVRVIAFPVIAVFVWLVASTVLSVLVSAVALLVAGRP